jgi:hypothetical protein
MATTTADWGCIPTHPSHNQWHLNEASQRLMNSMLKWKAEFTAGFVTYSDFAKAVSHMTYNVVR